MKIRTSTTVILVITFAASELHAAFEALGTQNYYFQRLLVLQLKSIIMANYCSGVIQQRHLDPPSSMIAEMLDLSAYYFWRLA